LEPNPRDQKQAGIREEFECLARAWKMLYINALDWLAFLNTVRTERFNDIMGLKARIPAIATAQFPHF
jgi:hypothetical protein